MVQKCRLLQLANRADWTSVGVWAQSHPHDLDETDDDGCTVFHYLCDYLASPAVDYSVRCSCLKMLIQIDEQRHSTSRQDLSVLRKNAHGMTPLMCACVRGHVPLAKELVNRVPEMIPVTGKDGYSAGHFAILQASKNLEVALELVEMLLQENSSTRFASTDEGLTMGSMLLRKRQNDFRNYVQSYPEERGGSVVFRSILHCCIHGTKEEPDNPLLHRFLQLRHFPTNFLMQVLDHNSSLLGEIDKEGNTPLHVAAANLCAREVIQILLEGNPSAARTRNSKKMLPLALAMQASGNTWNKDTCSPLFTAYPEAVESFGLEDLLYPHILARASTVPSTVFRVLHARPTLARWL